MRVLAQQILLFLIEDRKRTITTNGTFYIYYTLDIKTLSSLQIWQESMDLPMESMESYKNCQKIIAPIINRFPSLPSKLISIVSFRD